MQSDRRVPVSLLGFLFLGVPYAALGVAWPSMATELDRSLGELGILIVAVTVGYSLATSANGFLTWRLGSGRAIPVASALATASIVVWATAGSLLWLVIGAALLGAASGVIDAGVNAYIGVAGSTKTMGWLHAMFGVGSTLGPVLTTEMIAAGMSWRTTFWVIAGAQLFATAAFQATADLWEPAGGGRVAAPRLGTGTRRLLWLGLLVFAIYTGLEAAAGEWSFVLFTEGRAQSVRVAGYLVAGYWAALTAGRVVLGLIGDRFSHDSVLAVSLASTTAGAGLLWWSPTSWTGSAGLLLMGLGLAPIFPLLVLTTSRALGPEVAPAAVGYQIAAASLGGAVIPGLIGGLVGRQGVGTIPVVLAVSAVLLLGGGFRYANLSRRRALRAVGEV